MSNRFANPLASQDDDEEDGESSATGASTLLASGSAGFSGFVAMTSTTDALVSTVKIATARTKLIYGQKGKVIPESLEDEADMMEDGKDYDGGDGGHPEDEIADEHSMLNRSEQREVGEEMMLKEMQKNKMISPHSDFRSRWDLAQALLLIYIAINVPYRIGFDQGTNPWEFWFCFDVVVDIVRTYTSPFDVFKPM